MLNIIGVSLSFGTAPTLPLPMELRKQVFRKLKNEFSIFKSRKRDLTIGDVAHAQQNENKLSLPLMVIDFCHDST